MLTGSLRWWCVDIVLFDRDGISPQVLLARAQHIFLAPKREDLTESMRNDRLNVFRYLSMLLREHTEEASRVLHSSKGDRTTRV